MTDVNAICANYGRSFRNKAATSRERAAAWQAEYDRLDESQKPIHKSYYDRQMAPLLVEAARMDRYAATAEEGLLLIDTTDRAHGPFADPMFRSGYDAAIAENRVKYVYEDVALGIDDGPPVSAP